MKNTLYISDVVYKKENPTCNYTGHAWEGVNYHKNLSTTDIAKIIRKQLKKEFPTCKFLVTSQYYSGGSSLTVSLMKAPFKILKQNPSNDYYQLNHYRALENYEDGNNNGCFLTPNAWQLFQRVVKLVQSFNFDDSDGQIDYFHTNFYFHLEIGKWNKPFQEV